MMLFVKVSEKRGFVGNGVQGITRDRQLILIQLITLLLFVRSTDKRWEI